MLDDYLVSSYENWTGDYWHRTNGHAVVYRETIESMQGGMGAGSTLSRTELEAEVNRRNHIYGFKD